MRDCLKLLMEPLYDGIHGIHRDLFKAIDSARLWTILMIMKFMYTFSYGPFLGAKWMSESKAILEDACIGA